MVKRFSTYFLFIGFLVSLLAGCGGGGGGGGNGLATLNMVADWSHFGQAGISGQSQRWSFYDPGDTFLKSVVINKGANPIDTVPSDGLQPGLYHMRVELFSGLDLGGSLVGVLDEWVPVSGKKKYTAAVGTDPASIKVTPKTATFGANQSKQFYAAAYNSFGKATFVAPGTITWQALGGVSTVDTDGLVLATGTGPGSVLANHTASGLSGAATFTIEAVTPTTGKWTVLVYMNAANDLDQFSTPNMNQMEKVAGNPDVRFVVQWKQSFSTWAGSTFEGTRRYLVKPDTTGNIASELVQDMGDNIDMGDKNTLADFINWGKQFYPADHYVLVVWNHGNGWRRSVDGERITRGVSYDDQTHNAIQTWELGQALGSNHFDILAWDASLMQMAEVSDEIRDKVDYIVGSEESPPGAGYPYDLVFAPFRDNPNDTVLNLANNFVDKTLIRYAGTGEFITQSVIDPTKLPDLMTKIDALGTALINNQAQPGFATLIQTVRDNAAKYPRDPTHSDFRKYRDLWDVADRLSSGTAIVSIQTACADVKAAVEAAVLHEGHSDNEVGSHGIAIDFSPSSSFGGIATDYANLRMATETSWNEWLAVAP